MRPAAQPAPSAVVIPPRSLRQHLSSLVPLLFVGPAMLIVLLLVFAPALANVAFSLQNGHLTSVQRDAFVGLEHYQNILTDADVLAALARSLGYALALAVLAPLAGLGWALLLNEAFPLRGVYRILMMTPWILSGILVGRIWS